MEINSKSISYLFLCMCFLFIVAVGLTACGGGSSEPERRTEKEAATEEKQKEEETIAWKMAVIGEGGYVPHGDDLEKEYEWYLNKLVKKTKQNQQGVADITVKAWQMIREDVNPREDLLNVLKDLEHTIPDGEEGIDLAEIAALYVILRKDER